MDDIPEKNSDLGWPWFARYFIHVAEIILDYVIYSNSEFKAFLIEGIFIFSSFTNFNIIRFRI